MRGTRLNTLQDVAISIVKKYCKNLYQFFEVLDHIAPSEQEEHLESFVSAHSQEHLFYANECWDRLVQTLQNKTDGDN